MEEIASLALKTYGPVAFVVIILWRYVLQISKEAREREDKREAKDAAREERMGKRLDDIQDRNSRIMETVVIDATSVMKSVDLHIQTLIDDRTTQRLTARQIFEEKKVRDEREDNRDKREKDRDTREIDRDNREKARFK